MQSAARRWRLAARVGGAACAALCLSVVPASGAEERLQWDAPLACPDVDALRAAVAAALGTRDFDVGSLQSIRGRVEQVGKQWQLSLELIDESRRRTRVIAAPSCADLVQAAGVAIALALDATRSPPPDATGAQPAALPQEPEPSPALPAAAAPSITDVSAPHGVPADAVAPGAVLGAAVVGDGAALRGAAWGVELAGGVAFSELALLVYGLVLPAQSDAERGGGSVQFSLYGGGLRARLVLARGAALDVAGYAAVEIGRLSARGVDLVGAHEFRDLWLTPGLGLELARSLGAGWSLEARGGGLLPLLRQRYVVNGDELVHRPPALGLRAALALTLEWR